MGVNKLSASLSICLLGLTLAACCRQDQATSCNETTPITEAGSSDGSGNNVRFSQPNAIAVDTGGNLFVTDTANNTIRKISAAGVASTLAGSAGKAGSADGNGQQARFNQPGGIVIDLAGNLYLADTQNHIIRKVTAAGVVTTLAGSAGQAGHDDGIAGNARFNQPWGLTRDSAGNLYVTDTGNDTVRKITPEGVVTTMAGTAGNPGSADGSGARAQFNSPRGITIDRTANLNLYIADSNNNTIRKLSQSGDVSTLAGTAGVVGSENGGGQRARFNQPNGIVIDSAGNIRVSDTDNQLIRNVSQTGVVSTLAGSAGSAGHTDGNGSSANFNLPMGIAADTANNLYVADTGNNLIRKVTPGGQVDTLLRSGGSSPCLCLFKL
ncbi:NHL repeat-containing protein [Collimonas antrihumi]|uniref:NHL repeat-containing protein n=1 Tax=Collimonas antrihumi TaxID=1940615 RepID=UPI001B8C6850|nr:NHL repeat-containing protein [Collimonas antrihumi]